MDYEITVDFGDDESFTLPVSAEPTGDAIAAAQRWLDAQFVEFGCEPIRPTGKVLTADKTLSIALEAGAKQFRSQPDWAHQYARAAALALNRAIIRVNVPDRVVGY